MQPIFLIGFMCSGKTTLGHALSERLGVEFIDLDQYIEHEAGMTVREIFDQKGEPTFRQMECNALAQMCERKDVIVACGGGTPCQPGAMEKMNEAGLTIRLVPEERRLVKRLMSGRHKRPLIASIDSPGEMLDFLIFTNAKREPYYGKAKYRFDSTHLETPEEIRSTVETFINLYLPENKQDALNKS